MRVKLTAAIAANLVAIAAVGVAGASDVENANGQPSGNASVQRPSITDHLPRSISTDIAYPLKEIAEAGEGWVKVAYSVAANSKATNLETIDAVGSESYSAAVQDALRNGRFEAGTRGGRPAEYDGQVFEVIFAIEGENRAGVHTSVFNTASDQAKHLLADNKFDEAIAVIRKALTQPLNMYEIATLSHALTYDYMGLNDDRRALLSIRHATIRQNQFLAKGARPYAQALLVQLEAQNNNPVEALEAFGALREHFPSFQLDETLQRLVQAARAQLASTDTVRTDVELIDSGRSDIPSHWVHNPIRASFSFEDVPQGANAHFRLVCSTSIKEDTVIVGKTWTVTDGNCRLYFYGDLGAKFALVEK